MYVVSIRLRDDYKLEQENCDTKNALRLSKIFDKAVRENNNFGGESSRMRRWEVISEIAGAELDWNNQRMLFDDDAYLLFVLKWS